MALEMWRPRRAQSQLQDWNPIRDLNQMASELGRLTTLLPSSMADTAAGFTPQLDIYEDEKAIHLEADVPGVSEKDLDVRMEGNTLTLQGERKSEQEEKRGDYSRSERYYGFFTRSFTLPEYADSEKIEARFKNGVLKIDIPKREAFKPKQIQIKVQ